MTAESLTFSGEARVMLWGAELILEFGRLDDERVEAASSDAIPVGNTCVFVPKLTPASAADKRRVSHKVASPAVKDVGFIA